MGKVSLSGTIGFFGNFLAVEEEVDNMKTKKVRKIGRHDNVEKMTIRSVRSCQCYASRHKLTDFDEKVSDIGRCFRGCFHVNNIAIPCVLLSFFSLYFPFVFHICFVAR